MFINIILGMKIRKKKNQNALYLKIPLLIFLEFEIQFRKKAYQL